MSSHATPTGRYSPRVSTLAACVAALTVVCATATAWSQSLLTNNHFATTNTPKQVVQGQAKLVQAYDPASKLRLAISIKAPKMDEEEQFLKQLQDKNSPNFKKYLTPEQWNARFAPAAADEQAVVDWATSHGLTVTARYPNRLMVNVEGTVDAIQKAFDIKINRYEVGGEVEFSNDRDPVIPGNLVGIIEYVDGLNSILRMRPASHQLKGVRGPDYSPGPLRQEGPTGRFDADKAAAEAIKSSTHQTGGQVTNGFYDPSDIWSSDMYDFNALQAQGHCCNPTGNSGGTPPQTSIAVVVDGDFLDSDIQGFHNQYPYLAGHWFRHAVNGTPSCCSDEATLDVEWSMATSNSRGSYADTASIHAYEAAQGFGDFGTAFQQVVNDNIVKTVNISYGLAEDYLNGFGLVSSWHGIFNQMLGQGMTIMAASGDNGATAGCGSTVAVLYPESDPDVVSVGGTQLALNGDGSFNSEVTWTGDTFSGACSENDGGTGGGCSNLFAAPGYQTSPACGSGSRSVPDIALNASSHSGQNYYFEGSLSGVAGTSIASPMMSGFIAQANAYLLAIGLGGSPIGQANYKLYWLAQHANNSYEAHYPFYDVTSGCNSNDDTAHYGTGYYCASTGYDLTTGWGSFNALQLAWGINTYDLGDFGKPVVTFSGPFSGGNGNIHWYNTDQTVSWTVADTGGGYTPTGVAGFSQAWDNAFSDPVAEATPGSGNSFYSGPQYPNATSGSLDLASAGQGCHFATVDAWDNSGISSGNQYYYYICYDTVAPVTSASISGTVHGSSWENGAKVTLSATDASSGVAHTYYSVDGGGYAAYNGAFTITAVGAHTVRFYSTDVAGNTESVKSTSFSVVQSTTTTVTSSGEPTHYGQPITLTATVAASISGTPAGTVTFTNFGSPLGTATLSGGKASITVTNFSVNTHPIVATYNGSSTYVTSSGTFTEIVYKDATNTTITSSADPSSYGQTVKLTATVTPTTTGTPTGTVTFTNFGGTLGTATLSGGKATLTVSNFSVNAHPITASYGGDTDYNPSTSGTFTQTVNKDATSVAITSSANPSSYGATVTLTATVSPTTTGTPTGTVTFTNFGGTLGTATLSGGKATLTVSNFSVNAHPITAKYSGDSNYLTSTSGTFTQTVNKAATSVTITSSLNPSTVGQAVTLTATVKSSTTGTPTGTVEFTNYGASLGTATISGGKASITVTNFSANIHPITGIYSGDSNFLTSTSPTFQQTVNK